MTEATAAPQASDVIEYNFDGLVGLSHNYAGLAWGNVASTQHAGLASNPRQAALQGLAKMRFVAGLGVGQAVLPPQPRPSLRTLRALGFVGTDEDVIVRAAAQAPQLLRLCSSAAAMWTANAATVVPSSDATDSKVHLLPANLQAMFHRAIEAETTHAVLRAIFADPAHFVVHAPLPGGGQLADEGAANHTRLYTERGFVHLFAWGRSAYRSEFTGPKRFPARQTLEASEASARLARLPLGNCLFPQQAPEGVDAGAFHTDVLAVGSAGFLMLHERAFVDPQALFARLSQQLGAAFSYALARESELPTTHAIRTYPFNSQLLALPQSGMAILAPSECETDARVQAFFARVLAEPNPVCAVHYLDVRQSMNNGGGPACLRLRVPLTSAQRAAIQPEVFYSDALDAALRAWILRHYRDRLSFEDLCDPAFARESLTALDELTQLLKLGSVYDFQT